ncbi:MAG: sodium:proton antiporter NhaD, partial [Saprospiraceae bacterium]|nr:sodium:proton antiporter NhaD [Saprospiraceae bacterium]
MLTSVVLCFFIGYIIIVLEQPLKLDKSVPALLMGALTWALISVGHLEVLDVNHQVTPLEDSLLHILGKTAEILFFLLGAMTIVELVDLHKGFSPITSLVKTKDKKSLLWITTLIAFFLSAVLDNLTTTIVMVSILRKLVPKREERLFYVSLIIIAANAGGAWSPIGDVTTTMLWIGKKVSSVGLIQNLFLPSVISLILPVFIASLLPIFKGKIENITGQDSTMDTSKLLSSKTMLIAGLAGLIFVPIFKSVTHLPPYMGIMISLGIVWLISEYIHPEEEFNQENRHLYSVHKALSRIEISSIIFFLGILLAVGALESVVVQSSTGEKVGFLMSLANKLQELIPNQNMVIIFI